jgi:rod shape-determining protein MreC
MIAMLKRRHYITLSSVILLTLILLNLPSRTTLQLKLAITSLLLPLFGLGVSTEHAIHKAGDALVPKDQVLRQLDESHQENQRLRIELMRLEEAKNENARLHRLLNLPHPESWKLKLARVIARDPAPWWRTLRIDVGQRDGVTTNCPVLTDAGLVGRIAEVTYGQARVVVLGDPDCRVSVVVEGEKRDNGVIVPASSTPIDPTIVDLNYLSLNSQLKPGLRVMTSDLGGLFPKGIVVGNIVDFRSVDFGLYTEARVKLTVNANELEEVWVILP